MRTTAFPTLLAACSIATAASPAPTSPSFRHVDVDAKVEIGYGVAVADVNGDRKPDILLADKNLYVWYENPTWKKHVLGERLTSLDHVCLAAHDVDHDGKCEVAVGAGWNPSDTSNSGAVFYLKPPADRTRPWEAVALPHEPTVHRMRWTKNSQGAYDLIMVPLHGRGNKTSGEGAGVRLIAYHQPSAPGAPWTTTEIETPLHKTHNFDPVQWDADPEEELLVASKEGVHVLDRQGRGCRLTRLSADENGGAGEVRLGRLGGKRRFFATIEPMHGANLVVHTEPETAATDKKSLWPRQVLDPTLADGHALACGDLAGLGRDQIVVGWRAMGKPGARVGIKLFTPLDPDGRQWGNVSIDDNTMACEDLCLADLNSDGRLDIIAAGRATRNVKVYFNEGPRR